MSIFRDTFQKDIKNQLKKRQEIMGKNIRTPEELQYLNSRNAWIRMTSSVNVKGSNENAKSYVLQGGVLNNKDKLKSDIGSTGNEAYSTKTPLGSPHRLGIRPTPGITDVQIKSKSAYGSLREATVNFQCWDISELEDLELLYMRPGYTVLLEWGWVPYIDNNGNFKSTLPFEYYDILTKGETSPSTIFSSLYKKATSQTNGNYDAIFGYVKNYQWSARDDGGYDCQTTIVSTGEIIESIKINYVKPDLSYYDLYQKGGKGNGYLNEYFDTQGNNPSDRFAQEYEKNILAGVWTELALKIKDPAAKYKPGNQIYATTIKMPGLKYLGDKNTMIEPGSDYQVYITLDTFVKILNEKITSKHPSGEPLIKLSTRQSTYDGGTQSGKALYCVAHPLQISTDPSVCIIENLLWEDLLQKITLALNPMILVIKSKADQIVKDLIDASEDDVDLTGLANIGGYGGTNEDAFLTAIQEIISEPILSAVDKIISEGKYFNGANIGSDWKFSDGLIGLINKEFTSSSGTGNTYGQILSGITFDIIDEKSIKIGSDYHNIPEEIVNMYFLYRMKHFFNTTLNLDFSINMKAQKDVVAPSGKSFKAGDPITLDDFLKGATPPSLTNIDQGLVDMANLVDKNPDFIALAYTYYGYYTIIGIDKVTKKPDVSSNIILSADDAYNMIKTINDSIPDYASNSYFLNRYRYAEIGLIENIYVNLDFLYKQSLSVNLESQDDKEKNEINLYNYVKDIISEINKCLGSVANLEIHVDPIDSIGRIVDINYTEPDKANTNSLFELQVHNTKSTVRSYKMESKIFPNQSSLIAIGSQAKSGQLGINNNTMTDFNFKIIDRIFPKKAEDNSSFNQDPNNPIVANSLSSIITLYAVCHQETKAGSGYVDTSKAAKNSLRDIIAYFQNMVSSSSANRGILPLKYSFTMDGIGGLVIGHLFRINDDILPRGYNKKGLGATLAQTVTGISHKIGNNDWETTIDALNLILDKKDDDFNKISLQKIIKSVVDLAIARANALATLTFGGVGFFGGVGNDCDLFLYLSHQQGSDGAAQHYSLYKRNGKYTKYKSNVKKSFFKQNWPGAIDPKGYAHGGIKSAKGYDVTCVEAFYGVNDYELAEAFVDVQRQNYITKAGQAQTLINSSGKNRTGLPYATIKAAFDRYQQPANDVDTRALANFAMIENGLETDDVAGKKYTTMFQLDTNFADNPIEAALVAGLTQTVSSYNSRYTNFPDIDSLVRQTVPIIVSNWNLFKKLSGFNGNCTGGGVGLGGGLSKVIVIGDSFSPNIESHSTKAKVEPSLQQSGINITANSGKYIPLYTRVSNYSVNSSVTHVVISIGTNSLYTETASTIHKFMTLAKTKFPSAKFAVVGGAWGYDAGSGQFDATLKAKIVARAQTFYNTFVSEGATFLGYVGDTDNGHLPSPKKNGVVITPNPYTVIGQKLDAWAP